MESLRNDIVKPILKTKLVTNALAIDDGSGIKARFYLEFDKPFLLVGFGVYSSANTLNFFQQVLSKDCKVISREQKEWNGFGATPAPGENVNREFMGSVFLIYNSAHHPNYISSNLMVSPGVYLFQTTLGMPLLPTANMLGNGYTVTAYYYENDEN